MSDHAKAPEREKLPYHRPEIQHLGSVTKVTAGSPNGHGSDSSYQGGAAS